MELDLNRFRVISRGNIPEKMVFNVGFLIVYGSMFLPISGVIDCV